MTPEETNKEFPPMPPSRVEQEWEAYRKSPFYWSSLFYRIRKDSGDDPAAFELFCTGWEACRMEILQMLKKDLHNLDLSTDSCDRRYIEQIERLQ